VPRQSPTTQSVWDPASDHVERRFGFEMNGGPGSVVYSWIVYEGQGALPLVAPNLVFDDDFRLDTSGDYDKSTWATDPLVISDGRLNISREVVPVGGEVNITAKNMRFSPEEGAAIAIKCHVEADGVTSGYLYPMFGATDTEDTGAWWGGIDVGLPGPAGTAIRAIAGAGQVFNAQNTEIPSPFDGWIIMRAYNDEVGHAYTLQGAYNGEVQARRAGAYSAGVSVMVVAGGAAGTVRYQFRDSADVLLFETPDFATYQDAQAWSATNPDWMITINVLDTAALPYGPFPLERKDCIQTEAWDGHPAEGGTKLAEVAGPFFAPMRGNRFAVEALGTAGSYIDRMLVYEGVGALPAPPAPPEPPAPQIPRRRTTASHRCAQLPVSGHRRSRCTSACARRAATSRGRADASKRLHPNAGTGRALIRARTRDSGGQETGTFSADTEPTADEVNDVIAQALSDVEDDIGSDIPEPALDGAKRLAALRTAMLVELTFFPEQLEAGTNNQYDRLKTLYDEKLKSVERAVAQAEEGEEIGAVDEPQWPAYGGFGPVSGWDDRKF
jgi:hypothetical protein